METNLVYNEDCLTVMNEWIEDNSIALTVTSPPYLNIKEYSSWDTLEEYLADNEQWAKSLYDITVPGGKVCWNIQSTIPHRMLPEVNQPDDLNLYSLGTDVVQIFLNAGFHLYARIIWWHPTKAPQRMFGSYPVSGNILITNSDETIYVFKKPGTYRATESQKKNSLITKEEWIEYGSSVWEIFPASSKVQKKIHSAPFPKELPHRCIKLFSRVDDIVFDPFLGSGTTAEACMDNHRQYIGAELNTKYYEHTTAHLEEYAHNLF